MQDGEEKYFLQPEQNSQRFVKDFSRLPLRSEVYSRAGVNSEAFPDDKTVTQLATALTPFRPLS